MLTIEEIIEETAKVFNLTNEQVISKCRDYYLIRARAIIYHIARKYNFVLIDIAKAVNRHHSSIINSDKNFDFMCKADRTLKQCYDIVYDNLKEKFGETV